MSDAIVVFGASGSVGRACVKSLIRQGIEVIATGRCLSHLHTLFASFSPSLLRLCEIDLLAESPWPKEIYTSRCFIQCAGPSYLLSDKVIAKLLTQCTHPGVLIEIGGNASILARWHTRLLQAGWLGLVGVGVQPGLVGIILHALSSHFTYNKALHVTAFTGGLQPLTPAGLTEYLQAINERTGHPGLRLYHGRFQRVNHAKPLLPDCFPQNSFMHPFLDEEAVLAAQVLNFLSLSSFNITASEEITHLLNKIMVLGKVPENTCQKIAAALTDQTPWFCLYAEAYEDTKPNQGQCTYLTCSDSYAVTGEVAAWAALHLAYGEKKGGFWFSSYPKAVSIWSDWNAYPPPGVKIIRRPLLSPPTYEEGEL